jgi:hypothetical protein
MNPSPEIKQKVSELIKELNKDIDSEELRKAGTELELNMSRDYQLTLEARFIELKNEFNSLNNNANALLSIDDLYNFFSQKNQGVQKEDIQSLFELTERNRNLKVSINEFIYMYILLEEKIKLKKDSLNQVKNKLSRKLENSHEKLKEFEAEEYNSQGISKQNELSIKIIQIKNLQGIYKCKIILYLMNKSGEILDEKETQSKHGMNPIFNEIFSFRVTDDQCYVKCLISDSDTLINEGHGYFIIHLVNYYDQIRKEIWYDIKGEQEMAKVLISCCFTFNNKKKYTDLITKTSQQIDKLTQTIFQIENIIGRINEPFGLLYYHKIKEIKDKNVLDKSGNLNEYLSSSRLSVYSNQRNSKLSFSESPNKMRISDDNDLTRTKIKGDGLGIIQEEGGDAMSSNLLRNEIKSTEGYLPENYNRFFPKNTLLGKKSTQLIFFGALTSLVSLFAGKFDILNLVLFIFGLMMSYNVGNINGRIDTRRYFFYALLTLIVFDTFWILFLNREQNIESSFWRVIVFGLTILSLIIKIVLSYLVRNRRR